MKCSICKQEIELVPSAAARAKKFGGTASHYTRLFTCLLYTSPASDRGVPFRGVWGSKHSDLRRTPWEPQGNVSQVVN